MIQVGLVGIGSLWERYRPALSLMRQPIHIEAVFDPVLARAEKAAKELDADPVAGVSALAARGNVDAILVMDPDWLGASVLSLLSRQEKPVFCAPWLMNRRDNWNHSASLPSDSEVLIVPAMWRRFLPATIRLQELIATEIGQPREIVIDLSAGPVASHPTSDSTLESIVGWLDFCRNLFRAFPVSASLTGLSNRSSPDHSENGMLELRIAYPSAAEKGTDSSTGLYSDHDSERERTARVIFSCNTSEGELSTKVSNTSFLQELLDIDQPISSIHSSGDSPASTPPPIPKIELHCERGTARMTSEIQIQWQADSPEPVEETLTSDRTKEEIMLDIFCRRVIGGLVPVADLSDILKPIQLLRSCLNGQAKQS